MASVLVMAMLLGAAQHAVAQSPAAAQPLRETATAGVLAALPARGLAAAIAEAGSIEVPSADPRENVTINATQASRWTEGSYDVWHLTGGVRIRQGATEATAHEAVVWIEQEPAPSVDLAASDEDDGEQALSMPVRSLLVRMAGNVAVQSGAADATATATTVRGPRWTGRFWMQGDPTLEFASTVPAAATCCSRPCSTARTTQCWRRPTLRPPSALLHAAKCL